MSAPGFTVDVGALRAAVGTVDAAAAELDRAGDCVEHAHHILQSDWNMDQDSGADNRIESFQNRWRDEFDLIKEMMTATRDALVKVADGYVAADAQLAASFNQQTAAINGSGTAPPGPGRP